MKQVALALAVMAVGTAWVRAADDDAKKDLKALEGTWQLQKQTADGKEMPADTAEKIQVIFEAGGKWKVVANGQTVMEGTVKLDPAKKPKSADWTVTSDGDAKGKTAPAIYELDGDNFKHCYAAPDKERPTKFEAKEGSGLTFATFKRVKK